MRKIADYNGVEIYYIPSDKFKTASISVSFCDNISRDRAFLNSLLPAVLGRGCRSCPTYRDIAIKCQELYGTDMGSDTDRRGEIQLIQFSAEFPRDEYISALSSGVAGTNMKTEILSEVFSVMLDMIMNPVTEDGVFKESVVRMECENLENFIKSFRNDKQSYALQRTVELMCSDEPYSIFEFGSEGDGKNVTAAGLYEYYRGYFLRKMPVKIFYCGGEEPDCIVRMIKERGFHDDCGEIIALKGGYLPEKCNPPEVRRVCEKFEVSDGKLIMGYRIDMDFSLRSRAALVVFNAIFGGISSSKLFRNVREKESLAYYCSSRIVALKGILMCFAGIEAEDREKAELMINAQLESIKNGGVTAEELKTAKKMILGELRSYKDTQFTLTDYYISQSFMPGGIAEIDRMSEAVDKVSADEVIGTAQKIKLDTVYFMYNPNPGRDEFFDDDGGLE